MQTTTYKLNVTPGGVPLTIHISQYDVGLRQYTFQPYTSVGEFTYVSGATVTLEATKPDGYAVIHECTYNQDGSITYTIQEQLAAKPGRVWSKVVIRDGADVLGTGAVLWIVDYAGVKDDAIISDSDISGLEGYVDQLKTLVGVPIAVTTAAGMTDHNKLYLYEGSETGYTAGNWYYWNGSAWTSGGEYGSGAVEVDPTLSISGEAADAKATGDAVAELKTDINLKHINLFNPDTITAGKYLDGNGNLLNGADFFASDFIKVSDYESISLSYTHIAHWYTSEKVNISAVDGMNTVNADATVTVPEDAVYIRFSTYNTHLNTAQVGQHVSRYDYLPYAYYRLPYFVSENDGLAQQVALLNYASNGNLFNAHNIIYKYYINPTTGQVTYVNSNDFAYCPDYIPVIAGETICANQRMMLAYYDQNLNLLSAMQMDTTRKTVIPSDAKYARFSCSALDHMSVIVNYGENLDTNIGTYSYRLKGLDTSTDDIIVDINGNGDYTSFTDAVYMNIDNKKTIRVKAGIYDIKAEYIAKFGQSVVDNLSDNTQGINNFQRGIRLHDRKIVFEPGAHLVCDFTGQTIDTTHRFCALAVEINVELVGLDLDCTHTFYCVHDDYNTTGETSAYTNTYKHCRITGHNLVGSNCIGGGCHKYSTHIIDNCYFDNNTTSTDLILSADVRYHNVNQQGAEPLVYVSDTFFAHNLNVTYYGTQTTKMRAYVNNCFAPNGIIKRAESSSATVDNVELYAWNNQTN